MKEMILSGLWAGGATAASAILFHINKRDILWTSILGALGWVVFSAVSVSESGLMFGYFAGALCVAFLAEILALLLKKPAIVYLLPALYPLVPGRGMFLTMRAVVTGHMEEASAIGYETLMGAGAIALGIAVASSLSRLLLLIIRHMRNKRTE